MTFLTLFLGLTLWFNVWAEGEYISTKIKIKGQSESFITWGDLPTESFLSFSKWKDQTDLKALEPSWERIVRERNHKEIAARIYQCVGTCRVDRGEGFFNGSSRTTLYEGDEIKTIGESYAWIYMLDGTMMRASPHTSITINELNVGISENFINVRVNSGNVLFLSRKEKTLEPVDVRETDVIFYPYSEFESIPINTQKKYQEDDLMALISPGDDKLKHYELLNEKIDKNNLISKGKKTYYFIILPNASIMGFSATVEVVVLIGGKSYLKNRSDSALGLKEKKNGEVDPPQPLYLQMRGYETKELTTIDEGVWFEIDEKGKNISPVEKMPLLDMGEFLTKRIPSILIGREFFFERYSSFAFQKNYDPHLLAKNVGYRLWGSLQESADNKKSDLSLRLEFLKEYFRRTETTNLMTSAKFNNRLEERGESHLMMEYTPSFFSRALNRYYFLGEAQYKKNNDKETGEVLNSTKKNLWKKMNGIR